MGVGGQEGVRWVVGEGGEPKVGSFIHLTGKAAIVCPLKCTATVHLSG